MSRQLGKLVLSPTTNLPVKRYIRGCAGDELNKTTLLTCLALTWFNPHVYLDTVVLLGSVSTPFGEQQFAFAAGAVTGSFLFFFALGFGASLLRPIFAKPAAWRILEAAIAFVMWAIALKLVTAA